MLESIVKRALSSYAPALARGADSRPAHVLGSFHELVDAGGRVGRLEVEAVCRALRAAAQSPALTEKERAELIRLLKEALAIVGAGYGYGYSDGAKVKAENQPVDFETGAVSSAEESDGLRWEVCVIRSGLTADGKYFYSPEAVRGAVGLFNGVQCFADHVAPGSVPSVRDLVGWFSDATLVELPDGNVEVHATLNVLESSNFAGMLKEVYLRGATDTVGFSIHGSGNVRLEQAPNGEGMVHYVESLDRIFSVDLVSKPNAGGRLVALRAAIQDAAALLPEPSQDEVKPMNEQTSHPAEAVVAELQALRDELRRHSLRASVESALAHANLPEVVVNLIRPRLETVPTVEEAQEIIRQAQVMWAAATEAARPQAAKPVLYQVDRPSREILRLQATIAGCPIDGVEPYNSLREAYTDITGVNAFTMPPATFASTVIRSLVDYSSNLQASIDPTSWPYALGQALHRELIREYKLPRYDEWRQLVSSVVNLSDMRPRDVIRIGYYDLLPPVEETYQLLGDLGEQRAYYKPVRYGGLVDYTWEAAVNDDLNALRVIPRRLALSAKFTVWYHILNIFAADPSPTCSYDGYPLFSSQHSNLGTRALGVANFGQARADMVSQTAYGATNMRLGVPPKYLLVPPALETTARKLLNSEDDFDSGATGGNPWKGSFEIIVIPFWNDDNAWVLVADPTLVPTIEVGFLGGKEEPELVAEAAGSGSNFTAERITFRAKLVWGYCILDHRGMRKENPS